MLENLKESIGEAFTEDLREELETKIQKAIDTKAEVKAQTLVEAKSEELNEACEAYKAQLAEEAHKTVNNKISEINEMVDKYVDHVVADFISEHQEVFRVNEEDLRTQAAFHCLSNACLSAGIEAQRISESIYAQENCGRSGINFGTNVDEKRILESLLESRKELNSLEEENGKLIKMGMIAEMSEDLTHSQAKEFTELAESVEFVKDVSFADKLEGIKNLILEKECKEDEEDEEDEEVNESADIVRSLNESIKTHSNNSTNLMAESFRDRMKGLI